MAAPLYQWRTASCCWLGGWWLLRRSVPLAAAAGACDGGVRRGMSSSAQPSLYDVLGVTPRASSKHIKAAYFRLSKKYHPDRQSGDAVKFQQISAAYEVLGNRQKRRTYDTSRQHGHHGEHAHHHRHGGARHGPEFHAPRAGDPRAAPHTGRSVHYDYDAWSQAHYKELRWRENKSREDYAIAAEKQRDRREERLRGFMVCAVILAMAAYVGLAADEGFRRDPPPPPPPVRPPPPL